MTLDKLRNLKLDTGDVLVILAIWDKPQSTAKVLNIVFVLANLFGIKDIEFEPYQHGVFSEAIYNKLTGDKLEVFIKKTSKGFELTEDGLIAHNYIVDKLREQSKNLESFLEMLYNSSNDSIVSLVRQISSEQLGGDG